MMTERILIIDDETVLAKNLAVTLKRLNVEAVLASSYAEGIQEIRKGSFELVCADINLGDGNGLDLANEISRTNPRLPLMIMTGQDSASHRARAKLAKIPAFLTKPFSLSQFRETVASLLATSADQSDTVSLVRSGPRVMMYLADSTNMDKLKQSAADAARLVDQAPEVSVLLIGDLPGGDSPPLPPGVDLLKLPAVSATQARQPEPGNLGINTHELLKLRSGLIAKAIEHFRPDVFMLSQETASSRAELDLVFDQLSGALKAPEVVFGLEDIEAFLASF